MRACLFWLTLAAVAPAEVTISSGVPLRVALEQRVAIKHVGDPVRGRLVEPIYVFDRVALPAGSIVEGRIAEIGGVPARRRIAATLSGNLTPARDVRAQFDTLVLADGSRLPLRTALSRGTPHTVRVGKRPQKQETGLAGLAFKAPGRGAQLKSRLFAMLPYHRQAWQAGTLFNAALVDPLTVAAPPLADAPVSDPQQQEVSARLLTPISSRTARKGAPVEAVVTQPLFSADHRLLVPEGARLTGDVVSAQPARGFHRNGKVQFVFRQIRPPEGAAQTIQGYLEGVDADFDAHLALDSEGETRAAAPKARFIFPALAVAAAGLSFHQDYNAQGVADQDIAGRAESGAVGLGVIGTVLAQSSRAVASSIALSGAAYSVYTTFLARGEDVTLPLNTPVRVSLQSRGAPAAR